MTTDEDRAAVGAFIRHLLAESARPEAEALGAALAELLGAYDAWARQRAKLSEREGAAAEPGARLFPRPEEWHASDDTAVELLERLVSTLRGEGP